MDRLSTLDFNLDTLLCDTTQMVLELAAKKGLTLITERESTVPRILRGDSGRLQQVILHLYRNALHHTETGSVTLHVSGAAKVHQRLTLRLSMTDTGPGIPREIQGRLFSPYPKSDDSPLSSPPRNGLGLTICKHFVDMLGGTIGVVSEPGCGATFWFTAAFEVPRCSANSPTGKLVHGRHVIDISADMPLSNY